MERLGFPESGIPEAGLQTVHARHDAKPPVSADGREEQTKGAATRQCSGSATRRVGVHVDIQGRPETRRAPTFRRALSTTAPQQGVDEAYSGGRSSGGG